MSWNLFVSGGVAPPRALLASHRVDAEEIFTVDLPESGSGGMQESFEEVVLADDQTLCGSRRYLTAGFRYHIKIHYPYLTLADYRKLLQIITYSNNNGGFCFLPHSDGEWQFRVAVSGGCNFCYVGSKFLGYEGTLELMGLDLLRSIPIDNEVGRTDFSSPEYIYQDVDRGLHMFSASAFPGDFECYRNGDYPAGWTEFGTGGSAAITTCDCKKVYRFTQNSGLRGSYAGRELADCRLEVDFCGRTSSDSGGGIITRFVDSDNHYRINLELAEDEIKVQKVLGGTVIDLASYTGLGLLQNDWFTLKVVMLSNIIQVLVRDGRNEQWDYAPCGSPITDQSFSAGKVGLFATQGTYDFANLRVRSGDSSDPYYLSTEIPWLGHFCPESLAGASQVLGMS